MKIKWIKEDGFVGHEYTMIDERNIRILSIDVCKPGEYCLPTHIFPRTKTGMVRTTKTLPKAKKICEAWFKDFIEYHSEK